MRIEANIAFDIDDEKIKKYAKEYIGFDLDMNDEESVTETVARMIEYTTILDNISVNQIRKEG